MSSLARFALFSALAVASIPAAHAATSVIVSNMAGPGTSVTQQLTIGQWAAQKFNTGASGATVANWSWDVGQPQGGAMSSYIASDNAGLPGTNLMASAGVGVPTAQQQYTFFPVSGSTSLQANTDYWVVVVPANAGLTYNVQFWQTGSPTTGVGSLGGSVYSVNYGSSWINNSTPRYLVEINAVTAAVPEPSSLALLTVGGLLIGAGARRKARAADKSAATA